MDQQVLNKKISRFWNWFRENEKLFKDTDNPQAAVEAMDEHILEFGLFSWEIGQGWSKPYYLMISPNGDANRLNISYKLIKAAPDLRDWEFRYCKPPQNWNYQFEIHDRFLVKQTIDASEWEFVLLKTQDGYAEVILRINNMNDVEMDDILNAGEMALTRILGEEAVIDRLAALEVVREFSPENEKHAHNIRALRKIFEKLFPPA